MDNNASKEASNSEKQRLPKPKGKGIQTSPEVQAQIIAALLSGQFLTDTEVATATGVSKPTVSRIKKQIPIKFLTRVEVRKNDQISDLVVEFLKEALRSQKRIDSVTLSPEWLFRQDAASIATFYGVKADKLIRFLEAIERAHQPEPDERNVAEGSDYIFGHTPAPVSGH
jgi:hypothetical protein